MKTCSKCKVPKELDQFNKYKRAKDGLYYSCRLCANVGTTVWRLNNKDHINSYVRTQEYKDRYRTLSKTLKYKTAKKTRNRTYDRKKYDLSIKQWKINNPDKCKHSSIRSRAKQKQNLTDSYITSLLRWGSEDIKFKTSDITPEMIKDKRQLLLLTLKLKQYDQEKTTN